MDRALARQVMFSRFIWFACLLGLGLGWWRLMDRLHEERALEERGALIVNDNCPIDKKAVDVGVEPGEWEDDSLVGFCSDQCAGAWGAFNDAEQRASLAAAQSQNSND